MKIVLWDRPIRAAGTLIFGPLAAKEFMTARWPEVKDRNFVAASEAIIAAIDGRGSPDVACARFETAVRSAELV